MTLKDLATKPPIREQAWLVLPKDTKASIVHAAKALHDNMKGEMLDGVFIIPQEPPTSVKSVVMTDAIREAEETLYSSIFKAIPLSIEMASGMTYKGHVETMKTLSKATTADNKPAFPDVMLRLHQINAIKEAAIYCARNPEKSHSL